MQIRRMHNLKFLALTKGFHYKGAMVAPSHLKSLQALELSVRHASFTLAADELGITPAAVGQRVKVLEDYLGIELLVRGRRVSGPRRNCAARFPDSEMPLPNLKRRRENSTCNAAANCTLRRHPIL